MIKSLQRRIRQQDGEQGAVLAKLFDANQRIAKKEHDNGVLGRRVERRDNEIDGLLSRIDGWENKWLQSQQATHVDKLQTELAKAKRELRSTTVIQLMESDLEMVEARLREAKAELVRVNGMINGN